MTKLLVTGHWHLRDSQPVSRKDNAFETQFKKVEWVLKTANNVRVDGIVHCGDIFHKWDVSFSVLVRLAHLLKTYDRRLLIIPGSHDLNGHQEEGTAFQLMKKLQCFVALDEGGIKVNNVILYGIPLGKYEKDTFMFKEKEKDFWHIIVTHFMLTPNPVPFEHTLLRNVSTNADLVIGSDIHFPYREGKFVNPGCLVRWSIAEKDIKPIIVVVRADGFLNSDIEMVPCEKDVFEERIRDIEDARDSILNTSIESFEIDKVLEEIIKDYPKDVADRCRSLLKNSVRQVGV